MTKELEWIEHDGKGIPDKIRKLQNGTKIMTVIRLKANGRQDVIVPVFIGDTKTGCWTHKKEGYWSWGDHLEFGYRYNDFDIIKYQEILKTIKQ